MKTQELGQSGLTSTRVGLGVMRMAGLEQKRADEVVDTAMEAGIRFYDTADIYTLGESSRKFGAALKNLSIDRDSIQIQTKVGIYKTPNDVLTYDFSKKHILEAVDFELKNLGLESVDFLLLHRPDTLFELDDIAEAFSELKTSGKVGHFGVSNVNATQVELLQSATTERLEVNQLQFGLGQANMVAQELHVNMIDPESVDHDGALLTYSRLKKMTIQAWSPMQYGFFEGTFLKNRKFKKLNTALDELAQQHNVPQAAIAIAWILRHPAHMQVLLGSMSPEHLREMTLADTVELTREEWYKLYQAAGYTLP